MKTYGPSLVEKRMDFETRAKRWWVQAATPEINKRPKNKRIVDALLNISDMYGYDTESLKVLLKQLCPRRGQRNIEKLAYYENSYKYAHDKSTLTQPGRFLKNIMPHVDDKIVEAFTFFWKSYISHDISDYILTVGSSREFFKKAFTNYRKTSNIDYLFYKSISDSCMRHPFDNLNSHPAEAYASGDFECVTVKGKDGQTKARTVVYKVGGSYNSIYASDNFAAELVKDYVTSLGYKPICEVGPSSWDGAEILPILAYPANDDCVFYFLCPYVDFVREIEFVDGKFLLRVNRGSFCNSTSGYFAVAKSNYKNVDWTKYVS